MNYSQSDNSTLLALTLYPTFIKNCIWVKCDILKGYFNYKPFPISFLICKMGLI